MIQYISGILDKVSLKQRLLALALLLITIIALTLGDSIIKSFKPDNEAKDQTVQLQKRQIQQLTQTVSNLTLRVDSLSTEVSQSYIQCSNRMIKREKEIYVQIEELQKELTTTTVVRSASRKVVMSLPPPAEVNDTVVAAFIVKDAAPEAVTRTSDVTKEVKVFRGLDKIKKGLKH